MSKALVLIDLQNDYFPGGSMELVGADTAVRHAASLLDACRQRSSPVIHIQHLAKRAGATFFLPGTAGAEIHSVVRPGAGERVVVKHFTLAHDACATRDLQFGARRVAAEDVQLAYLAALNGAFATVRSAAEVIAL